LKLLTRDTDYAIRALCCLARRPDEIASVNELVRILKVPRPFLRKILQTLNRSGLLRSYKGVGGGFAPGFPAEKIFLVDVIRIFQGPFKLNECFLRKRPCPGVRRCALKKRIDAIERHVVGELASITIASLLK
jgi:Rrf2 family protein